MIEETLTSVCEWCGDEFYYIYDGKGPRHKKYCCQKCRKHCCDYRAHLKSEFNNRYKMKISNDQATISQARELLDCVHEPQPKPEESVIDIDRKAREAGMSYGHYVAMLSIRGKMNDKSVV